MEIIKLNVGGTIFYTGKATLCKSTYFCNLISGKFGDKGVDGSYFIDDNPEYFKHILDKLRHPEYQFPDDQINYFNKLTIYYDVPTIEEETKKKEIIRIKGYESPGNIITLKSDGKIKIDSIGVAPNRLIKLKLTGPYIDFSTTVVYSLGWDDKDKIDEIREKLLKLFHYINQYDYNEITLTFSTTARVKIEYTEYL